MNYTFEFMFMPRIIDSFNSRPNPQTACLDSVGKLHLNFFKYDHMASARFDWSHFSVRKHAEKDVDYWFFTFPAPQKEPEAKWGIVVHYHGKFYHYYTFEKGNEDNYFFCQLERGRHENRGSYSQEFTEEKFISLALDQEEDEFAAALRALSRHHY